MQHEISSSHCSSQEKISLLNIRRRRNHHLHNHHHQQQQEWYNPFQALSFFTADDFSIFSMASLFVCSSAELRSFIYTLIWKYVYRSFLINVISTCIFDHLKCVYFIHLSFLRLVIPRDNPTTTLTLRSARNTDGGHLTLRVLMSYIYGAPILDVSRSHTTTQHSR